MNKPTLRSWLAGLLATDETVATAPDTRSRLAVQPLDRRDLPSVNFGSAVSGSVYVDANCNGVRDGGEAGIAGVKVTLTGKDNFGKAVCREAVTDCNGNYTFKNLGGGCYTLTEAQPAGYRDGRESGPTAPTGNDTFGNIKLGNCSSATGYNFGEEKVPPPAPVPCPAPAPKGSHGKGSSGKGSHGKGSSGKGSRGKCDLWSGFLPKGDCDDKYKSCGYGYQPCDDKAGSKGKGSSGKGSKGKGSSGKGSKGKGNDVCVFGLVGGALKSVVSTKLSLLYGIGKC